MITNSLINGVIKSAALLLLILPPAGGAAAIGKSPQSPQDICAVVDEQEKPVADAAVLIEEDSMIRYPGEVKTTTSTLTDAQGRFFPPVDAPDSSKIIVSKPPFALQAFTAARRLPERITLRNGQTIHGTVVTDRGKPVAGALLGPIEPAQHGELGAPQDRAQLFPTLFARTGPDGSFQIDGLHPQTYRFTVSAPAIQPRLQTAAAETTTTIAVRTDGTTLTGYLMGSRDGTPKPGMFIRAMAGSMELYSKTDTEGRFVFPCLPAQEWSLRPCINAGMAMHPATTAVVPAGVGEFEINIKLNQGARLSGRVLDADTSAPLPQISLTLVSSRDSVKESRTDVNGYFSFDVVDAYADLSVRFDEKKFTHVSMRGPMDYVPLETMRGEDVSTVTIALTRRAPLAGKILSPAGKPMAGADVAIAPVEDVTIAAGKLFVPTETAANSMDDGIFQVGLYPPGRYSVTATYDHLLSEAKIVDVAGPTTTTVELKLKPGVYLSGLTVDAADRPVSGSLIKAYPPEDAPTSEPKMLGETAVRAARAIATATSSPDGTFTFRPLLPQRLVLIADHPDYALPTGSTIELDPMGTSSVKLVYSSGKDFSALVTDEEGKPIRSAEVRFFYMKDLEGRSQQRETDESGRVAFRGLPADKLERVAVHHPDYVSVEIAEVKLPQEDYPLQLHRRGTLVVTVESKNPLATNDEKLAVLLFRSVSHRVDAGEPPQPSDFTLYQETRPVEGKGSFSNLEPGWYKAALRTSNIYAESDPFTVTSGLKETTIKADGEALLRGRITDKKSGQPVPAATVSIEPLVQLNNPPEPKTVAAAEDGHFEIRGMAAGTYTVIVHHEAYPQFEGDVTLRDKENKVYDIPLSKEMAAVSGRVTYAGEPVKNALVVLAAPAESESPIASALTGDDGTYLLKDVTPGSYVLSVEAPIGTSDNTSHKGFALEIAGTSLTRDVTFEKPTTVRGRVTINGRSAGGQSGAATLLFMPMTSGGTGATAEIKSDGTFETNLEPGTYSVGLEDRPGKDITIPKSDAVHSVTIAF